MRQHMLDVRRMRGVAFESGGGLAEEPLQRQKKNHLVFFFKGFF